MPKTVAVIFGSRSAEHDISIVTAINAVIKPLKALPGFDPLPVYIDKKGRWFTGERYGEIDTYTSGRIDTFVNSDKPVQLHFENGLVFKSGLFGSSKKADVVFPATHGTFGEDGSLMGLLRMANVPFVGCGMTASVLSMDKVLSRLVCAQAGIAQNKFKWFYANEFTSDQDNLLNKLKDLKYPLFVKPAHLGSSIAISRVKNISELKNAIEVAAHYDDKVLVEEEVENLIELTLPIMGHPDSPKPALLEKPLADPEKFFDFDTKYLQGGKKGGEKGGGTKGAQGYSEIPARVDKKIEEQAIKLGTDVYRALGCSGTARIDMLVDSKAGKVYFNEVNPLPGSLYAHNWRKAGVSNAELVEKLIEYALETHQQEQKLATTFDTSFLKQF